MFPAQVADFYRGKGYQVREKPRVRGHQTENVYAVDLVAEGPLGALLVSFGDAGGIDVHEVGRVKALARDVGATPVLAAPSFPNDVRRAAAQMGVVLVDEGALDEAPIPQVDRIPAGLAAAASGQRDLDAHPWPASGRARAAAPSGAARAVDVDELVADLAKPAQPARLPAPATPATRALWRRRRPAEATAIAATLSEVEAPPPDAAPGGAAPRADAFAWLNRPAGAEAAAAAPAPAQEPPAPVLAQAGAPAAAAAQAAARARAGPGRASEPVVVPRWAFYSLVLVALFLLLRVLFA